MSGTTSETKSRGLDGVVAAATRMSHVDGQNGVLIIGGYELKELAGKVTFEEAAHLLWKGRLPNAEEKEELTRAIAMQRALPETTMDIVREAAKKGAPPIDTLRMACATLSLDLKNPNDISPGADFDNAKMLVARFPTIVAAHTRIQAGLDPIAPRTDLSLAANFLYMVFGKEPDPIAAKALDTYWVTVIDHGMNASTFTGRVIASTRSDMVSARCMVARPVRCSTCCSTSRPSTTPIRGCATNWPPAAASWASVTAFIRCATRAPRC
jgi:citrate synthase